MKKLFLILLSISQFSAIPFMGHFRNLTVATGGESDNWFNAREDAVENAFIMTRDIAYDDCKNLDGVFVNLQTNICNVSCEERISPEDNINLQHFCSITPCFATCRVWVNED